MAIAVDATSNGFTLNSASRTQAHTCTGSDLVLIVNVVCTGTNPTITGVTYNSVSMTRLGTQIQLDNGYSCSMFYLVGPATGTNNIVASKTPSTGNIFLTAASYTGVSQVSFPDASTQVDYDNTATATTSVTTVADNCWTVLGAGNEGSTPTAGTGTTLRVGQTVMGIYDSNGVITPAGSTSLQTTQSGTTDTAHFMLSMAPAGVAPSVTHNPLFFGASL